MSTEAQATTVTENNCHTDPRRPVLTATELRQVAEWAHSVRGANMCMAVKRPIGGTVMVEAMPLSKVGKLGPQYLVIPVDTQNRVQDRRAIAGMKLKVKDKTAPGKEVDLFDTCKKTYGAVPDAMFWTESSVEKFLVPYYASVHSSDDTLGEKMQKISEIFDGDFTEEGVEGAEDAEVQVYAMLHLPKSEYVASPPDAALAVFYTMRRRPAPGSTTVPAPEDRVARLETLRLRAPAARARAGRA